MSVLKTKRDESKAEFVNNAIEIYIETLQFLTRLSARYSRLIAGDVIALASEVINQAEEANSIFPSDDVRKELRERHLLEARAALRALDIKLSICYDVMIKNPQGCFTTGSGNDVQASDAIKKLGHMAASLGEKIDKEKRLLTSVLKGDKTR